MVEDLITLRQEIVEVSFARRRRCFEILTKQAIATCCCVRSIAKIQKLARAIKCWELHDPSATGQDKLLEDGVIQKNSFNLRSSGAWLPPLPSRRRHHP
ncbi:hypothetical protein NL676_039775 [Syzygium grande]|nr:hypothetical protein NL676_039775 [Syzygium grande]